MSCRGNAPDLRFFVLTDRRNHGIGPSRGPAEALGVGCGQNPPGISHYLPGDGIHGLLMSLRIGVTNEVSRRSLGYLHDVTLEGPMAPGELPVGICPEGGDVVSGQLMAVGHSAARNDDFGCSFHCLNSRKQRKTMLLLETEGPQQSDNFAAHENFGQRGHLVGFLVWPGYRHFRTAYSTTPASQALNFTLSAAWSSVKFSNDNTVLWNNGKACNRIEQADTDRKTPAYCTFDFEVLQSHALIT